MTYSSLIAAALLTFAVGVAHSWLGEHRLIGPLLAPDNRHGILVHRFARQVLRFAWHVTTLAWWGFAAILGYMAFSPVGEAGRIILVITALMFLITGAVVLMTSRGRHLAWPAFLAIGFLSLVPLLQAA